MDDALWAQCEELGTDVGCSSWLSRPLLVSVCPDFESDDEILLDLSTHIPSGTGRNKLKHFRIIRSKILAGSFYFPRHLHPPESPADARDAIQILLEDAAQAAGCNIASTRSNDRGPFKSITYKCNRGRACQVPTVVEKGTKSGRIRVRPCTDLGEIECPFRIVILFDPEIGRYFIPAKENSYGCMTPIRIRRDVIF